MGTQVTAAIVAGVVSLLVTFGKVAWDAYQASRTRGLAARERLDEYRAPLLAAVDDLGRRMDNIRNDNFLRYLGMEQRSEAAFKSTLFRFAQYLGWIEVVYGYGDRLRFDNDDATRKVAEALADIGWILSADEFDRADESEPATSQLMLWREEQRAIGELMRGQADEPRCIGYASFAKRYNDFAPWFERFAYQLAEPSASKTDRFGELHRVLVRLMKHLDVDNLLVRLDADGEVEEPPWARPTNLPPPTKHTKPDGSSSHRRHLLTR